MLILLFYMTVIYGPVRYTMQEMECEHYYICEYHSLIMESVPLLFRYIFISLLNTNLIKLSKYNS